MSRSMDHVFRDVIPQRVVVGIVDNDAFNRTFRKNPFNFKNFKMTLCGLLKNNEIDLIKPIFRQREVENILQPFSPSQQILQVAAMIMEMQ